MNIQDQYGNPVDLAELTSDQLEEVAIQESYWRRGWDAGARAALEAIRAGKMPGFTTAGAPVKAQPFDVAVSPQRVTFNLPAPVVTVTPASSMAITSLPDRLTHRVVQRDARGLISEVADHESDGAA